MMFIEKDRLKDAVKQAKLLFMKEATPENLSPPAASSFCGALVLALRMSDSAIQVARHHPAELGRLSPDELADEFVSVDESGLFDLRSRSRRNPSVPS